jgi:hypothetical protein
MTRIISTGLIGLILATAICAEDKPAPTMPDEVTLTTGRVLRKVQVIRWEKDRVVLKHAAGADPIAFSVIKSISLDDLQLMRDAVKTAKPKPVAAAAKEEVFTIKGQAYDKGMDQAYKFVDMTVGIYKKGQQFEKVGPHSFQRPLPEPLVAVATDADGRFQISTTATEGLLYARAVRSYRIGSRAVYEWTIPFSGSGEITLTGSNAVIVPLDAEFRIR